MENHRHVDNIDLLKGRCQSQGIRVGVQSIYKLRALRRETLLWINFLNKVTLVFWNVLETKDHLLALGGRNLLGQKRWQGFKHGNSNLSGFSQLLDHHAAFLLS